MERFAPKKGKTNCLIRVLSLLMLLLVDAVSIKLFISQNLIECAHLNETIKNLTQIERPRPYKKALSRKICNITIYFKYHRYYR